MCKLSVIIPGFNTRREWWVRCVRSVAAAISNACGEDGEILCIDDGSNDVVQSSLFEGISGVRLIRLERNSGLPTARNVGMEMAQGEFVTFVDSDDEVKPTCYLKSIAALERYSADVAVFGVRTIYDGDGWSCVDVLPEKYYGPLRPEDVKFLYSKRLFYYSWNKVFRRSYLVEHDFWFDPLGVPCEDAIFNVRLVMEKAKWVTVDDLGYVYYRYEGSLLSSYKPTYVQGTRACTERWREYKSTVPNASELFGSYDETSEQTLVQNQWTNIWRRNSPYGLAYKWNFARNHKVELGKCTVIVVFKKALIMWVRSHLYFRPLRIWHQKRVMIRRGAKVVPL